MRGSEAECASTTSCYDPRWEMAFRNLDTGKCCTLEQAQAELRDPRAVTTLTPRALSDDKRKTTATHLSQKALKLANTAVAADTNGNV